MICADYTDVDTQNKYYEGCTTSVEITNLLVYKLELINAGINFTGHLARLACCQHV